ncbi:MAG: TetR-like C-terminal domain-containing protein, partial [Pseudomonadota bacterium]|nr:TetR-like C-terminal domain-containing protein [Pseudomonadota bacterium]
DAFKTLPTLEIPNNGNLLDDLKDLLNQLSFVFTQTDVLPVLHILTGEMSHDELLEKELLPWLQERYSPARTIIERAIKRGELQENLDLETAQSIVVGPLLTMVSYSRTTINERVLDNLFNFIVKALEHNPKDSE